MVKVLIVDDESDLSILFKIKFKKEIDESKLVLDFCENGQEALTKFNEAQQNYDLIISDINMPVMDGLELLEKIKNKRPDQTVHIMSAYESEEYRNKAKNLGASCFFAKPLNFKELKSKIL